MPNQTCVICGESCYLTKPEPWADNGQVCYSCNKLHHGVEIEVCPYCNQKIIKESE